MKKITLGVFLFVLFQSCVTQRPKQVLTQSSNNKQSNVIQKVALLIGVSDYDGEKNDLNGIHQDIERMQELLLGEGFKVTTLYDELSLGLVEQLQKYTQQLSNQDSFVFYYSGHGLNKKDISGDESDGKDEMIVLSDGNENKGLLDDELDYYFSRIKAKKLIIFDSCYSGTASKSLGDGIQVKAIPAKFVTSSFPIHKIQNLKSNTDYIVLSSSKENEKSLGTKKGSLFTKYFSEIFSEHKSESFTVVTNKVAKDISSFCKEHNRSSPHPTIEASNENLKEKSFRNYFK